MAPSSKSTADPSSFSSGIQTSSTGDRHIPQSTRADGSVRKEIKIRPGYRPPEDVEVYKNRTAEAYKNRGKGGIPGADGLKESLGPAAIATAGGSSAASNKNAKRKEARKRAKAAGGAGDEGVEDEGVDREEVNSHAAGANGTSSSTTAATTTTTTTTEAPPDPEAEREKQARNLKKKLRQARELKEKKDSGGDLLPEQFAKVIKIQELIRQLDGLGFDENGDEKTGATKGKDAG